ncbi:ADP-ribosylglycohydrolase family protein [Pontibacter sp. G13]|uniref:ADP-ribosylglycohydrolase family protein n=1 Tax=Pontibacter sp. G13 TaxID=3074898 RepID=UPI00288A1C44|nr:ADP-ribosylglycohydrolase family protein [Pontibacter sp. G13]WNJ17652.1 ADP-ribosylglycohydrolase family protein [Pontibacter sp. G13]
MLITNSSHPAYPMLFGLAIGDALGVPFEFRSSEQMRQFPATDMVGFGTHNQPAGTWSDDSSLTFCLAEALVEGYSLEGAASRMVAFKEQNYWTPRGELFDIGLTTSQELSQLAEQLSGGEPSKLNRRILIENEEANGNGALMRISPLLFQIWSMKPVDQYQAIFEQAALTHPHSRSAMACMMYLNFMRHLIKGIDKHRAYELMKGIIRSLWDRISYKESERMHFDRIMNGDIRKLDRSELRSGGYVMETIEATFWCLLMEDGYSQTVLSAINLGHDTDTTGAVVGALAGVYYGLGDIPEDWLTSLARMEDIFSLGAQLEQKFPGPFFRPE